MPVSRREIASYWSRYPQGSLRVSVPMVSKDFYDAVETERYSAEPFIIEHAGFEESKGKMILEVGCGLGTDARSFANAGADTIVIDVAIRSLVLAKLGFHESGLTGSFVLSDAEHLPFRPRIFEHVYCYGVLHHLKNTALAISELARVLNPAGTLVTMVYSKPSIPYLYILIRYGVFGRELWRDRNVVALLSRHTEDAGWAPLTKMFTGREIRELFRPFGNVRIIRTNVALPGSLGRLLKPLEKVIGFYAIVKNQ